jgi:hypothetical protein
MEVSGQFHPPATLSPGERAPSTHCVGGWVGPEADMNTGVEKNLLPQPGIEPWISSL